MASSCADVPHAAGAAPIHANVPQATDVASKLCDVPRDDFGTNLPLGEIRRIANTLNLLSLFSRPDTPGGLDKRIQWWGANVRTYDLDISVDHDLVDEATWEGIRAEIDSVTVDGIGSAAPCSTFWQDAEMTEDLDR